MMRIETINGTIYEGETSFGTEFVHVTNPRILVYNTTEMKYNEVVDAPKSIYIPIFQINLVINIETSEETVVTETENE